MHTERMRPVYLHILQEDAFEAARIEQRYYAWFGAMGERPGSDGGACRQKIDKVWRGNV